MMMRTLFIYFMVILLNITSTNAIVLEEIPQQERTTVFSGRAIGYYLGSFDPIHKGHEGIISRIIDDGLVDYCLIYPAWGGDSYKQRTDVKIRLDMLFELYKDNPKVIVTRLSPQALQQQLTINLSQSKDKSKKRFLEIAFESAKFIGIMGSDLAIDTAKNEKFSSILMRGIAIPEKYYDHTLGGIMALPVESFIVFTREGDDISILNNAIADRRIISIIESDHKNVSSTVVRNRIKNDSEINGLISDPVASIIDENKLYQ